MDAAEDPAFGVHQCGIMTSERSECCVIARLDEPNLRISIKGIVLPDGPDPVLFTDPDTIAVIRMAEPVVRIAIRVVVDCAEGEVNYLRFNGRALTNFCDQKSPVLSICTSSR